MKAISLLAFVLVNCEFGFSRPHPENLAKRDIFFPNPVFNSVFRNRHPKQSLIKKFMGGDGSDITNNDNGYYVIQIPIGDNNSDYFVDQNESDRETSEVLDENPDKIPIKQEISAEVMRQNTKQNSIKQEMTAKVIGQNSDQSPLKQETSTEAMGQNLDQDPSEQETSTGVVDQNQDLIKQKTSTEVIGQNPDQISIKQKTSTGVIEQNQDQKPFKESIQASEIYHEGDLETPAQSFIVVDNEVKRAETVSLKAVEKDDINTAKYMTANLASNNSMGCVPRFQSEIAIVEQKMLTYFINLVKPQENQNEKNIPNTCGENEAVTDTEKNTTYSVGNSKYIYNKFTSEELTNSDKKPAPLASQPNTLVRDGEVEDNFFLFEKKQNVENNSTDGTDNVSFPLFIPYILVSNSNIAAKNQSSSDNISSMGDALDSHASYEASNNDPDEKDYFDIGSPVPIIPHKPAMQINTTPKIVDLESDTTLKPQSTSPRSVIISESEDEKRHNRSSNLVVKISNIPELIGNHNNTIKTQKGEEFISGTFKFIEENYKPLNTNSGPTDKSSTNAKYIQKHRRNLTNEEVQIFSKEVLQLWNSNQISGNRKLSTNKSHDRVNNKQNYKKPNSNGIKRRKHSTNEVSAPGLEITEVRHGTAVTKRGPPVIRRGTSTPSRGTYQDGLLTSIFSRILQAVLRTDHQTANTLKRIRRNLSSKKNKYIPKIVLKSIARKFFAPKYFPKSGKKVFSIPGGSAIKALPSNFLQGNYNSIHRNLVVSNLERKEVTTLGDIFNDEYLRTGRSNKLTDYSEEFEQIM